MVPIPPLVELNTPLIEEVASVPVTSEDKLTSPLYKDPEEDFTTPVPKEAIVVVPFCPMVNNELPVEDATINGLTPPVP